MQNTGGGVGTNGTQPQRPPLVFVSYGHLDADWRRRFRIMLDPLVRNQRLEVWADDYIQVGDEWRRDIDDAIDRAALGLLLVSKEFLASPFIMNVELPALWLGASAWPAF